MPLEFGGYNDLLRAIRGNVGDIEATRGKILQNQATALDIQGKQNELQQYPENLNWLRESREQERLKFAQAQETYRQMIAEKPLADALKAFAVHQNIVKFGSDIKKATNWYNLDENVAYFKEIADLLYKAMGKGDVAPPMPGIVKRETFLKAAGGDEAKAMDLFEKFMVGGKEQKEQSDWGQIAMDVYGMSYDKLNPEQKADVDAKVDKKQGKKGEMTEYQEKSLELREKEAEENRQLRKQMHDDNLAMRQAFLELQRTRISRLPPSAQKDLNDKSKEIKRYADLMDSFKDEYSGKVILGPTGTAIHERLGTAPDRVDWWKNWKMLDYKVRHELFGATLTGYEKKAWDAATISENTSPINARKAMQTRMKIAQDALTRDIEGWSEAGYGTDRPSSSPKPTQPKKKKTITLKSGKVIEVED